MNIEKKHLLVISRRENFITELEEELSLYFKIHAESSIHIGYHTALILLPDVIVIDQISLSETSLKNLNNFKSTHFLNKSCLIMYADERAQVIIENTYKKYIDEIYYNNISISSLGGKIIKRVFSSPSLSNYWKDAFMGLFHLLSTPAVLLQKEQIVCMNQAFKETFKIEKTEGLKLTDFVNCKNKIKVKASLRNFARGKHMKAVTKTALKLKNDKIRNARISFSKLDKSVSGQFIMLIDFYDQEKGIQKTVGSNSKKMKEIFEENSTLTNYSFTKREKEIIQLLCKGYKTKEISEVLFISPKTIEKHRANIVKRTNSDTILESIIYAINHNLIDVKRS